jgi:hypothetical protein
MFRSGLTVTGLARVYFTERLWMKMYAGVCAKFVGPLWPWWFRFDASPHHTNIIKSKIIRPVKYCLSHRTLILRNIKYSACPIKVWKILYSFSVHRMSDEVRESAVCGAVGYAAVSLYLRSVSIKTNGRPHCTPVAFSSFGWSVPLREA